MIFRGYGIQSDQEIAELVGYENDILNCFSASIEECHRMGIFTQIQVNLEFPSETNRQYLFRH